MSTRLKCTYTEKWQKLTAATMSRLSPCVFRITSTYFSDRSNLALQSHLAIEVIIEKEPSLNSPKPFLLAHSEVSSTLSALFTSDVSVRKTAIIAGRRDHRDCLVYPNSSEDLKCCGYVWLLCLSLGGYFGLFSVCFGFGGEQIALWDGRWFSNALLCLGSSEPK